MLLRLILVWLLCNSEDLGAVLQALIDAVACSIRLFFCFFQRPFLASRHRVGWLMKADSVSITHVAEVVMRLQATCMVDRGASRIDCFVVVIARSVRGFGVAYWAIDARKCCKG